MKLTALTCMYEKPPSVMEAVLKSLLPAEERIVVLDRPSLDHQVAAGLHVLTAIVLDGPPGWRSPCLSWNAGMKHVTGDGLLIVQGDVVLDPGAVDAARLALQERPAAYFGQVIESNPEIRKGPGHSATPLLCSSANPRPLTYLLAVPTDAVRAIGGWDEAFQAGVWYEDDDLTARLWKHGLDFIFDDRISGMHQTHQRAYAHDIAIARNQVIMLEKHGTLRLYEREHAKGRMRIEKEPGRMEWRHVS